MQPAPADKNSRDPQSLIVEQPGKLILDPGVDRNRIVVIGMVAMFVMGGLAFAFVLFNRRGADVWLVGVAVLMALTVIVPLVLALKRSKVVFDLEARRMRLGKREIPFEDIVGVVLSVADSKPRKAKTQTPATILLGLVQRTQGSDLAERVVRFTRTLSDTPEPSDQLTALGGRLRTETERLAKTSSPVAAFQAADRLAVALRSPLFDLRGEPTALPHKALTQPLRKRLNDDGQPPPDPGPPPSRVTEEIGPSGPLLRFRRPKRQPLVTLLVNLGMLLVLLVVFFLMPSRGDERDFNWGQIWPLVMAILLVIPALLKSLFSQNRLELGRERLRYVTRFLGEKSREVEIPRLRHLLIDQVGPPALVFIADGPALRLSMPLEAATWTKARIELFLVSGA